MFNMPNRQKVHSGLFHTGPVLQGVAKITGGAQKYLSKLSAMGQEFPMDITWERLILLGLGKKRPISRDRLFQVRLKLLLA